MLSLEGQELGGCKLIRKLGEGGMGVVYLAEELDAGNRLVAIKVVRAGDSSFASAESRDVARRFEREAALLANLSHPNILPIYGSGVQDDYLYIIMLYAQEGSLADAIRGRSRLNLGLPVPLDRAVDIISQVASALQYCHDRGIVHRDVKPGNVLIRIEPGGHWRMLLADFGVARPEQAATARTVVTGTFAYMAPEQFSARFSPASDQYALGVMAYQLLTGRVPFEGDLIAISRAHMSEDPPPMTAFNANVPPGVESVIRQALAKDPAQRFASVALFAQALQAVAQGTPYEAAPGAKPARQPVASRPAGANTRAGSSRVAHGPAWPLEPTPRPPRTGRIWIVALALVLLGVGLIAAPGLLNARSQVLRAQQTAAAQTAAAQNGGTTGTQGTTPVATGTQGTTPGATGTTSPQSTTTPTVAQPTSTPNLNVPTATAPASLDTDVSSPPPAPSGVGALTFSDPAPTCDSPSGPSWTVEAETNVSCASNHGSVSVAAKSATSSGCIEQSANSPANGFAQAIGSVQSQDVVLGFRLGGKTSGGVAHTAGYYFKVVPATSTYVLQRVDSSGTPTVIQTGTLSKTLATHFAPGVTYNGDSITLYINGNQIGQANDSTFSKGGIGLCSDGRATFQDAQMYALSS